MDALNLENRAKVVKPAKSRAAEPSMPKAKAKAPAAKGTGDEDDSRAGAKPKATPKTRVRGKHRE